MKSGIIAYSISARPHFWKIWESINISTLDFASLIQTADLYQYNNSLFLHRLNIFLGNNEYKDMKSNGLVGGL